MADFLWPSAPLGKTHESALEAIARAQGRAGARFRSNGSCRTVCIGRDWQDTGADSARLEVAAQGRAAGIDPVPNIYEGGSCGNGQPYRCSARRLGKT